MLPNTYTRLTYIESSGTQNINTNFNPNNNTRVVGKFLVKNSGQSAYDLFGAESAVNTLSFKIGSWNATTYNYGNQGYDGSGYISTNVEHDIDFNKNVAKVDETTIVTFSSSTFQTPVPLYICANNRNGTIMTSNYGCRVYSCKIYDNGTLVRDFIPAKRNIDSVLGLYDLVNDVFYTNSGSGTFIGGTEIKTSVNPEGSGSVDISTSADKFVITATPNPTYSFLNWLLKGYTQLEYIESSGTQRIDTGITPSQNISCEYEAKHLVTHGASTIFGSQTNDTTNRFMDTWLENLAIHICGNNSSYIYANAIYGEGIHHTIFNQHGTRKLIIDDVEYGTFAQNMSNSFNINLFANNSGGSYDYKYARIYNFKIYDNGTLVRDFIPVIRHSDGAIGLLDKVNLKFYGNSGTGTFIGGNPV